MKKADMQEMHDALSDDWVAECGVCRGHFAIRKKDSPENPAKYGSFCPDCRASGATCPGVLHWTVRKTVMASFHIMDFHPKVNGETMPSLRQLLGNYYDKDRHPDENPADYVAAIESELVDRFMKVFG